MRIYLQHVIQTIIYFMEFSLKIFFQKYSSPLPLVIEWWSPNNIELICTGFVGVIIGD